MDEATKTMIENIEKGVERIEEKLDRQNGRLRKVEINQAKIVGGVAVLVVVVPIILKFIF